MLAEDDEINRDRSSISFHLREKVSSKSAHDADESDTAKAKAGDEVTKANTEHHQLLLSPKQLNALNANLSLHLSRHHTYETACQNIKADRDLEKGRSIDSLSATRPRIQEKRKKISQTITHKGHQLRHFKKNDDAFLNDKLNDAEHDSECYKLNNTRWPILLGYCLGEDNVSLQRRVDGHDDHLYHGGGALGGGSGTVDETEGLGGAHFRLDCCFVDNSIRKAKEAASDLQPVKVFSSPTHRQCDS